MRLSIAGLLTTGCLAEGVIIPVDGAIPDTARYEATLMATALDRMVVQRIDDDDDTCALLTFVRPWQSQEWSNDVDLPPDWGLEWGGARVGTNCDPHVQLPTSYPVYAAGEGDWVEVDGWMPTDIRLDIVLEVADGSVHHFDVEGLEPTW